MDHESMKISDGYITLNTHAHIALINFIEGWYLREVDIKPMLMLLQS